MAENVTGTLTLDTSKTLHKWASPQFLHKSYYLPTIEHSEPLLPKIYLDAAVVVPGLYDVSVWSNTESL